MAPTKSKGWEDGEESTPPSSPPVIAVRRSKWDDEEEEDGKVLESWSAAEDSEVERENAKAEAARKAKVEAEAAANKKSRAQRIAEKQAQNKALAAQANDSSEEEEDEAARRIRLQRTEQDADLKHAEDLLGTTGISKRTAAKTVIAADPNDPTATIDLGSLGLFNPTNKASFTKLRETLVPVLTASSKKAHYPLFLQEFTRDLTKELQSSEIKAIASKLTTLSNEKMKEEKLAEKGGKKSKAAKTKTSLVASRDESFKADTTSYENEYDE
ncbi:MAG: Translation initiation factor 3 subunit J component [Geoglossum simile]|nr:MAG: Translation initiation factor 3 subunit J component [Geoglossum simile]